MSEQQPTLEPIVISPPPAEFFAAASAVGVEFEPTDVPLLAQFLQLMLEANRKINLTAITEPAEAWRKHVLDALAIVGVIVSIPPPEPGAQPGRSQVSVVDVGSGGGLPAVPLAIVLPDVRFTLVEATGKKAEFLKRASSELKLANIRVLASRAETIGQDHRVHREAYDVAMARALGHLAVVIELCGPLVRPGGIVVAVKGGKAQQELEESADAMGKVGLRHVQTMETPTGKLVIMEKTTRTPRLYPRRDGEPARVPLGLKRKDARRSARDKPGFHPRARRTGDNPA